MRPADNPYKSLIIYFVLWKVLLISIACLSPGQGYDTSTSLLLQQSPSPVPGVGVGTETLWNRLGLRLISKLTRWDAIYFARISARGYLFEQEWAFGWGFTRLISWIVTDISSLGFKHSASPEIVVALVIANVSHLFSVLVLYRLSGIVFPQWQDPGGSVSFLAAFLHIVSPAGLFLTAPYAEALFSFLSFSGFCLYAEGRLAYLSGLGGKGHWMTFASGVVFGLATTVRSNGLLGGLLFLYDAVVNSTGFVRHPSPRGLRRLIPLILGGSCVALAILLPQYIAYSEYCIIQGPESSRPWCKRAIPSVYTWVQDHYWGVGFLRYWSVSNLPLFLLAAPMLYIMVQSAVWGWTKAPGPRMRTPVNVKRPIDLSNSVPPEIWLNATKEIVGRFALPQFILAILALTSYHVQIINRLSSGYPVWYWWLAVMIVDRHEIQILGRKLNTAQVGLRWMVLHAIIQGGLFSSFLPPA